MDDAEAEAVLLALGPQLEWTGSSLVWDGRTGSTVYYIYLAPEVSGSFAPSPYVALGHFGELITHCFDSLDSAKQGCGRHYATGRWE